ncbi:MAG TPA: class D sortase [Coriobacteriia bacterium]
MDRAGSPSRAASLVTILPLAFLILGIGCIAWALANIGAVPLRSADAYRKGSPTATTFAVRHDEPAAAAAVATEPVHPDPAEGESIGILSIPALNRRLPIIQGTGANELKEGVGHFIGSVLPGEADNCVLSGHRDTVFAGLGKLKTGDRLIVETSAGTYTYEVRRIRIVDKDDRTVIVPADHAVLTLSTCYPFRFVGNAPDRYVLSADLVARR